MPTIHQKELNRTQNGINWELRRKNLNMQIEVINEGPDRYRVLLDDTEERERKFQLAGNLSGKETSFVLLGFKTAMNLDYLSTLEIPSTHPTIN